MDTVERDLRVLADSVADLMEKSTHKQLQKIINSLGVDLSKAEQADLLKKAADVFKRNCEQKLGKLVEECQLEHKMKELSDLVVKSEKLNEELGVDAGYRPKGYEFDMMGPMKKTNERHKKCVIEELDDFDEQIQIQQSELSKKRDEIRRLEKEMDKKINAQKSM